MPSKPEEQPTSILTTGIFKFYEVTEHGIAFKPETNREAWLEVLEKLLAMHQGSIMTAERTLMLLADALNFGEDKFSHEFSQAIDGTRAALGLSPKTIANAQWVYGKIEAPRRKSGLTLGHMSVLASLPVEEQDMLMQTAIEEHMTVATLKEHVAEHHPKTKRGKDRKKKAKVDDGDTAETIRRKLADCAGWLVFGKPTEKMKADMESIYKAYRRKWASGRARK